jgi:hypothetical protein
VRVAVGWNLLVHGWGKVVRGPSAYIRGFVEQGFDPALPWVWASAQRTPMESGLVDRRPLWRQHPESNFGNGAEPRGRPPRRRSAASAMSAMSAAKKLLGARGAR